MNSGLSWFRIDVDFDDKFELVCAEYGSAAFEVIVRLWQKIYREGYYCEWNSEVALLFAKKYSLGGNAVSEIVQCAVKRGLFSEEKLTKYGILTSSGIQKWYLDSVERRKEVVIEKDYLMADVCKNIKNVNIIYKNVNKNPKNVNRNKHSTVHTVQNSTVQTVQYSTNIMSGAEAAPDSSSPISSISLFLNTGEEYPIFKEQIKEWSELYPNVDVEQELRKMRGWLQANPSRRKTKSGVMRFVNNWLSKAQDTSKSVMKDSKSTAEERSAEETALLEEYAKQWRI